MHHPLNLGIIYKYPSLNFKLIFIITFNCEFLIWLYCYFQRLSGSGNFVTVNVVFLYLLEAGHISGRNILEDSF